MEQFKRVQVIRLPTNNKAPIISKLHKRHKNDLDLGHLFYDGKNEFHKNAIWQPQHLYIISDDEIKKDDWIYDWYNNKIYKATEVVLHNMKSLNYEQYLKKVIATTDTSLNELDKFNNKSWDNLLPQPSQQFIEKYIESYNKGEIITDVLVEYEGDYDHFYNAWYAETVQLKVNPKDNTITIKKLKDSWNKEEVINLLNKFGKDTKYLQETYSPELDLNTWINNNL